MKASVEINKLGLTLASLIVFIKLLRDSTEFSGQCISNRVARTLENPKSMTGHLTVLKKKGLVETDDGDMSHATFVYFTKKGEELKHHYIQSDKYDHKNNNMPIILLTEAIEKLRMEEASKLA